MQTEVDKVTSGGNKVTSREAKRYTPFNPIKTFNTTREKANFDTTLSFYIKPEMPMKVMMMVKIQKRNLEAKRQI